MIKICVWSFLVTVPWEMRVRCERLCVSEWPMKTDCRVCGVQRSTSWLEIATPGKKLWMIKLNDNEIVCSSLAEEKYSGKSFTNLWIKYNWFQLCVEGKNIRIVLFILFVGKIVKHCNYSLYFLSKRDSSLCCIIEKIDLKGAL